MTAPVPRDAVLAAVLAQHRLGPGGIHGVAHWERVRENGLLLAERTGARADVVGLFALFHDACRHHDGRDREHGPRGARLARQLHGTVYRLDLAGLGLLVEACEGHTGGGTVAEVTVATCWDADRLDLGRVWITPRPERLCTDAARDPRVIAWGLARSVGEDHPRPW